MKILITDPVSDSGINLIKESGFDMIYETDLDDNGIKEVITDIDGWIVRSGTKATKELIKTARQLKVIGRAGVGVDNIETVVFRIFLWHRLR